MLWKKSAGFHVWQMGRASSISEQPESIFFMHIPALADTYVFCGWPGKKRLS